ncbi:cell growth-regulating nucleolar protein [Rhincodon typus]|uniref:cell growth-regulating nucleolar protein n=1 Tax=Rhincodon typus TaxID=259920 RepID=UPI00202F7668|nr:cell growth-regulating nucleolar protein [Rhincodon typus]
MNESNVSPKVREILEQMNSYDNIPRKKIKFQNWMKNSLQIYNEALQGQVWDVFAAALCKDKNKEQPMQNDTPNGVAPAESVEVDQNQAPVVKSEDREGDKQDAKEKRQKKSKKGKKLLNSEECKNSLKHELDSKTKEQNKTLKEKKKKLKKLRKKDGAHIVEENGNQAEACEQEGSENALGSKKGKKRKQKTSSEGEPNSKREKVEIPEAEEMEEDNEVKQGKFNWKRTIKIVLQQSPEQEISIKKLRKKVLSQYYAESGDSNYKSEVELLAIFYKKISSNPKFKVLKDKVKLVK